ncbi:MAG TPA: ABC transporter ATP-binding protein [Gemmatimonadales bacterium]|nr:ABC transporter ATP-binding protein [Gemmatimonadales bacterium]
MMLQGTNLSARYPGAPRLALDAVTCGLEAGRLLAVVGPNGSGKSTLVRALLGLVPLESGTVSLDGRPLGEWSRQDIAAAIGAVSQREETLFSLRVREAVMLGRYPRLGPLAPESAADHDAVRRALERCDAWDLRDRRTDTLSGGEWQRVRVARALAQEPRALLLDEPTAALDIRHEMELFELVHDLVSGGLAGLIVTHELNLSARYADRMILLDGGRVVGAGEPAAVLTDRVLAPVFRWPLAVTPWRDGSPQVVPLKPSEAES